MLGQTEAYEKAYGYLRDHIGELDYTAYRRDHLPIGSGVTEAACKTVFSQRLKGLVPIDPEQFCASMIPNSRRAIIYLKLILQGRIP